MANIERSDSDSKGSGVSVLTGESALTLSVRGVPGEQFDVLCKEALMSEGEETIGSILRKIIDKYTKEVLRDPEFLEKIKEILRDSERRKEMGRLVVLLEIYGQPDNQDYAE
jgi:hypothetical protein